MIPAFPGVFFVQNVLLFFSCFENIYDDQLCLIIDNISMMLVCLASSPRHSPVESLKSIVISGDVIYIYRSATSSFPCLLVRSQVDIVP